MRDQDVQGIAGVVRDAEDAADELEHRRVHLGDDARRKRPDVDDQRRDTGGRRPAEIPSPHLSAFAGHNGLPQLLLVGGCQHPAVMVHVAGRRRVR